jgi:hypothetical protein
MYTLIYDPTTDSMHPNIIIRDEDGAHIPDDPTNRDWQEFQEWIAKGNHPNMPHDSMRVRKGESK